jgi:hypothetical protein
MRAARLQKAPANEIKIRLPDVFQGTLLPGEYLN